MKRPIVRLSSLQLTNIKNVKKGIIYMPNTTNKILLADKAEVLGIYGQNGSGKTAIVDALYFLQKVMVGANLDHSMEDYIDMDSNKAEIMADFNIFIENIVFEVGYRLYLSREEKEVFISREVLSVAKNENGSRTNKTAFMDYQRKLKDSIFKPKNRLDEVVEANKEIKTDLIVARKIAEKSNCSYIFGESSREIFCREYTNGFKQYSFIISSLFEFALKDLFVIRNTHSGVISANFVLPMAFRIENDSVGAKGDFTVPLTEPILVDEERKNILETIVEQINIVLYTIIPGIQVTIKNYGKQSLNHGEQGWRLELMSKREGMKEIPIRMESEGIIKIISILNALIQAFGNPSICLVIDELDAGVFEYMLGELLDIFKKSAKGQLIFTSHNLRALEMLDKESIMFSTTNPNNRYIHMKSVRESNNLRNMYIRSITLGGQSEEIYEETDSLKIARAFRKAGRGVRNE
ncbi:MAG TPA: ATP-binding protein [Candidatus Merdenecus merdavium]|nr:ATP-binding protein [Candidatus Merdenecus merdavium]